MSYKPKNKRPIIICSCGKYFYGKGMITRYLQHQRECPIFKDVRKQKKNNE
jgi:hypothetical protein